MFIETTYKSVTCDAETVFVKKITSNRTTKLEQPISYQGKDYLLHLRVYRNENQKMRVKFKIEANEPFNAIMFSSDKVREEWDVLSARGFTTHLGYFVITAHHGRFNVSVIRPANFNNIFQTIQTVKLTTDERQYLNKDACCNLTLRLDEEVRSLLNNDQAIPAFSEVNDDSDEPESFIEVEITEDIILKRQVPYWEGLDTIGEFVIASDRGIVYYYEDGIPVKIYHLGDKLTFSSKLKPKLR